MRTVIRLLSMLFICGTFSVTFWSLPTQSQENAVGTILTSAQKDAETLSQAQSRLTVKLNVLRFEPDIRDGILGILSRMPEKQKGYTQSMVEALDYAAVHPRSHDPFIGRLLCPAIAGAYLSYKLGNPNDQFAAQRRNDTGDVNKNAIASAAFAIISRTDYLRNDTDEWKHLLVLRMQKECDWIAPYLSLGIRRSSTILESAVRLFETDPDNPIAMGLAALVPGRDRITANMGALAINDPANFDEIEKSVFFSRPKSIPETLRRSSRPLTREIDIIWVPRKVDENLRQLEASGHPISPDAARAMRESARRNQGIESAYKDVPPLSEFLVQQIEREARYFSNLAELKRVVYNLASNANLQENGQSHPVKWEDVSALIDRLRELDPAYARTALRAILNDSLDSEISTARPWTDSTPLPKGPETQLSVPRLPANSDETVETLAQRIVNLLATNQFVAVAEKFNADMARQVSPDRLRAGAWPRMVHKYGPFQNIVGFEKFNDGRAVQVTCALRDGRVVVRMFFDKDRLISALWIQEAP